MATRSDAHLFDLRMIVLLRGIFTDTQLDAAMAARLVLLPSEAYIADLLTQVDVDAIYLAR